MVVRNMLYDAMNYAQQVAKAAASHASDPEARPTSDEFLSGFWKDDRLMPVITLVINISGKPWDGARTLHDMLALEDRRILPYIQGMGYLHSYDPAAHECEHVIIKSPNTIAIFP